MKISGMLARLAISPRETCRVPWRFRLLHNRSRLTGVEAVALCTLAGSGPAD